MDWLTLLNSFAILGLVIFGRFFLSPYLSQKGRNLATKEDIAEITETVERVRTEHLAFLEELRANLSKTVHVHRTQVDLELDSYKAVWDRLVEVRRATLSLRPLLDSVYREGEDESVRKQERLTRYQRALDEFIRTIDQYRPFYPHDVFESLNALVRTVHGEAVEYGLGDKNRAEYWMNAQKNVASINDQVNSACETIRARISRLAVIDR